ncbi:MAG: PilN domain-containing protein [Nitrosomonadales bacterium]|nr:PilN domain-containing protein [Nitrosomonadales bacterium]
MTELRLDYQKNAPFPWLGVCLAGVVAVALVLLAIYFVHLRNQVDALEFRLDRAASKESARKSAGPTSEAGRLNLSQEIKNANDALHHLSVPWGTLFDAVESSRGSRVTLLTLEPDFEKRQVKIGGEAKNYDAIMKYITEMQGRDIFGPVYLQHHEIRHDDPEKPVRFTLLANWQDKQ